MTTPETEFERELKISVAAQDRDLVAFVELEILGTTSAVDVQRRELIEDMDLDETLQLRSEIRRLYGLDESEFKRVLGNIAAQTVGEQSGIPIQSGRTFFNTEA